MRESRGESLKLKFINSITPVNRLEWIEEYLELPFELFCKHDELTGFITSGNKIRSSSISERCSGKEGRYGIHLRGHSV
jgi:hypothetical protein